MKSSNFLKKTTCELYCCLREPMRLCHWAGFFLFDGLPRSWCNFLRCKCKFSYLYFHGASVFGQTLITGFNIFWFFLNTVNLITISNILFYLTGLIATLLLLKLANNWNQLVKKALDIEMSLTEIRRSKTDFSKYRIMTYLIMALALVEHIMSIFSKMSKVMVDLNEYTVTTRVLEKYVTNAAPFIFKLTSYSSWKAAIYMIINLQATFVWNITDVMTMCISMYLISYFHDLNHIIHFYNRDESMTWEKIRVFYSQLVALVKEVDSKFCYLVLLSFFTNIFFICVQFFYTLNYGLPKSNKWIHENSTVAGHYSSFHSTVHLIYYVYSFAFLMTRACTMCLLAANVHKAAQEPQFVVGHVPTSDYTLSVQRFSRQVRYTTTALSGVYFYVTRGTLLKVAGTFLTYELVLMQFYLQSGLPKYEDENKNIMYNYTFIY